MMYSMKRAGAAPIAKFLEWLTDARKARIPNHEAAAVATGTRRGKTSVRFVLLKGADQRGFVFFTDTRSRKGAELARNPFASMAIYWQPMGRQVRIEGKVERVAPGEADAYWKTRPRQSRLAASASHQSATLRARRDLMARFERLAKKFKGRDVPRPRYWSGYRIVPRAIEFWTHREHRLHDRVLYLRRGRRWRRLLLQP
jgi:pyridoxamine 5'-phosphate oxidase